jgi:hypothetical protein
VDPLPYIYALKRQVLLFPDSNVLVMDETAKEQFKWKFYRLAVQLNAIILLAALAVLSWFLVPAPYQVPACVVLLIIALVLSWNFVISYRLTRAWLDEH